MEKLGIIGIGSMGSMLLSQIIENGVLRPNKIYISNRSREKMEPFAACFPTLHICENNIEVAQQCNCIMLCVEPSALPAVIREITPYLGPRAYLMISTSIVAYEDLEKLYNGPITKFMPTLTGIVHSGVTLVCHNDKVSEERRAESESMLAKMNTVKIVSERAMQVAHITTASMPAYVAELIVKLAEAAERQGFNLTRRELLDTTAFSFIGASDLMFQLNFTPEDIIRRVSTPGGITFEGIQVMEKELPEIFDHVFDISVEKYGRIEQQAHEQIEAMLADTPKGE